MTVKSMTLKTMPHPGPDLELTFPLAEDEETQQSCEALFSRESVTLSSPDGKGANLSIQLSWKQFHSMMDAATAFNDASVIIGKCIAPSEKVHNDPDAFIAAVIKRATVR